MRKEKLGGTGLEVSEIGLGTWGLSGEAYGAVPEGESRRVMERARACGVTLFDTADSYASGRMETELGEVLSGDPSAVVVTKWGTDRQSTPPRKSFDLDFLKRSLDASRTRLGQGPALVGMLHHPSLVALEEGLSFLSQQKKDSVVTAFGLTTTQKAVLDRALELGVEVVSLPYNIFCIEPYRSGKARLAEKKVGVLLHSVLAYGLLAGRWGPHKDFPFGDHRRDRWPDGSLRTRVRHLDAVRPLVSGEVTTMRAAALRYALQAEPLGGVLLGPKSVAQFDQLIREARAERPYFSEQKLAGLEGRLSNLGVLR